MQRLHINHTRSNNNRHPSSPAVTAISCIIYSRGILDSPDKEGGGGGTDGSRSISRLDRDISGQFIKADTGHPSPVLAWFCTRRTMALEGMERRREERGWSNIGGCVCVTGPPALTEAARQSDWPILLVIACRSQSRLVGEINTVLDAEFMRL